MSTISIQTVTLKDGSSSLKLTSPYHPDLPQRLRALGGKWDSAARAWYFPPDLSHELRQLCLEVFGIDPLAESPADLVDVRFVFEYDNFHEANRDAFWLFGREIVRRPSRDSAVRPGEGVSIISGGFDKRGGSARNPALGMPEAGTVLLIRGVPRALALAFQATKDEGVVTLLEAETPQTALLEQALTAAASLAALLQKLDKAEQDLVIRNLVQALEGQEA